MQSQKTDLIQSITIIVILFVIAGTIMWVFYYLGHNKNTDTDQPSVTAVVNQDAVCYESNSNYSLTITKSIVAVVIAKDITNNWLLLRLNEKIDCWVELIMLEIQDHILERLSIAEFTPPTITPVHTLTANPELSPSQLVIQWKIINYDCLNGIATSVTIDLNITGGVPQYLDEHGKPVYDTSPKLPIYTSPEKEVTIDVYSNTPNKEPSGKITFTVPNGNDTSVYDCKISGNKAGAEPSPVDPTDPPVDPTDPPVDPTDPPVDPPICYNPQGHEIPCKKK